MNAPMTPEEHAADIAAPRVSRGGVVTPHAFPSILAKITFIGALILALTAEGMPRLYFLTCIALMFGSALVIWLADDMARVEREADEREQDNDIKEHV